MIGFGLGLLSLVGCRTAAPHGAAKSRAPGEAERIQTTADALLTWHLEHYGEVSPRISLSDPNLAERTLLRPLQQIRDRLNYVIKAVDEGRRTHRLPLPGTPYREQEGRELKIDITMPNADIFDARGPVAAYPARAVPFTALGITLSEQAWNAPATLEFPRRVRREIEDALAGETLPLATLWTHVLRGLVALGSGHRNLGEMPTIQTMTAQMLGQLEHLGGRLRPVPVAQQLDYAELWTALAAVPVYPIAIPTTWLLTQEELYEPSEAVAHDLETHLTEHLTADLESYLVATSEGGLLTENLPQDGALSLDEWLSYNPEAGTLSTRQQWAPPLQLIAQSWAQPDASGAVLRARHARWSQLWPGLAKAFGSAATSLYGALHEQERTLLFAELGPPPQLLALARRRAMEQSPQRRSHHRRLALVEPETTEQLGSLSLWLDDERHSFFLAR